MKPKVTPDGVLVYERVIRNAADIDLTPDPGVEYAPPTLPRADTDVFDDWVARYARACYTPDWKAAWRYYARATSLAFPMTATVRDGALDASRRASRGAASLTFDFVKPTGVTGYGYIDAQGHPLTSAKVLVDDPQAVEALKPGSRAEILFHVLGIERADDLQVRQGRFRVEITFGRVK